MTTTANIQTKGNTAIQHTNDMREEGTMNHENNNINMVARISNAFRMGSISKMIGVAAIGLALTIGVAMPGAARADLPSVSGSTSTNIDLWNDDFSLVAGVPDAPAKVKANSVSNIDLFNDDFSLVYGTPDAPAKVKANSVSNIDLFNDDFSLLYGIPDVGPGRAGTSAIAPAKVKVDTDIDLFNDDFSLVYGISDNGGW